jgi:2-dehydro-3-deoxyglucarate aldolase
MGITGEFDSHEFIDVMDSIINRCKKYNIPCGDHVVQPNQKLLEKRIQQGYRFIAYGTDGIFTYINSQNPKK